MGRSFEPAPTRDLLTMTSCALSPAQDQIGHQLDLLKFLLNEKIGRKNIAYPLSTHTKSIRIFSENNQSMRSAHLKWWSSAFEWPHMSERRAMGNASEFADPKRTIIIPSLFQTKQDGKVIGPSILSIPPLGHSVSAAHSCKRKPAHLVPPSKVRVAPD